ncbi:hypothetical protein I552_7602 [Mycobacterium xenopi 3993]|nr:hypothetical protein I552_7602 [Mycobacterium xenopi 3993]
MDDPHVTPARSATCLAVAASKPSSMMQRTVSSMIFARVSSPRLRARWYGGWEPPGDLKLRTLLTL